MNWFKKRKIKRLLKKEKIVERHYKPSYFIKKILDSLLVYRLFRFVKNLINKLNTAHFGLVFIIFCFFMFGSILIADKVRSSHYLVPRDVNQVYQELGGKYVNMTFVAMWLFFFGMANCCMGNRRPRKPQIYPKGDSE